MLLKTYETALFWAVKRADEWRVPQGIEKISGGYVVRCLPCKDKRFGVDALCQAIEPEGSFSHEHRPA